jgi:glycosyltransferase involved in cell wall biosynthesis
MKISIITVVYNNKDTIQAAMNSVLSQDYDNLEYIVIDGASTDGTIKLINDVAAKYPRKNIKLISERDNGIYDAMNKGIDLATGEILGTLNSDDVYIDNQVLKRVSDAFSDKSIESSYSDLVYVDKYNLNKIIRYWKSCDYRDGLFTKGWVPPHPTFFLRKKIYQKYGLFDLDYRLAADFELMVRFLEKYRIRSVYIPKVLVKMRMGGATNKSVINILKQNLEIYRAGKKNGVKISLTALAFKKSIDRIIQFISRPEGSSV